MNQPGHIDTDTMSFRQLVEGMSVIFNPAAAGDLDAVIQFNVSGQEPGIYQLIIRSGACAFRKGPAALPSLVINTPSEIWRSVSRGEISGADALLQSLYTIEGDAGLFARFGDIFKRPENFSIRDDSEPGRQPFFSIFRKETPGLQPAAGCRPAGPLRLPGMAWNYVFFLPWWLFWITFSIPAVGYWASAAVSFALATHHHPL